MKKLFITVSSILMIFLLSNLGFSQQAAQPNINQQLEDVRKQLEEQLMSMIPEQLEAMKPMMPQSGSQGAPMFGNSVTVAPYLVDSETGMIIDFLGLFFMNSNGDIMKVSPDGTKTVLKPLKPLSKETKKEEVLGELIFVVQTPKTKSIPHMVLFTDKGKITRGDKVSDSDIESQILNVLSSVLKDDLDAFPVAVPLNVSNLTVASSNSLLSEKGDVVTRDSEKSNEVKRAILSSLSETPTLSVQSQLKVTKEDSKKVSPLSSEGRKEAEVSRNLRNVASLKERSFQNRDRKVKNVEEVRSEKRDERLEKNFEKDLKNKEKFYSKKLTSEQKKLIDKRRWYNEKYSKYTKK